MRLHLVKVALAQGTTTEARGESQEAEGRIHSIARVLVIDDDRNVQQNVLLNNCVEVD